MKREWMEGGDGFRLRVGDFGAHRSMEYHLNLSSTHLYLYNYKVATLLDWFFETRRLDTARKRDKEGHREEEELLIWYFNEDFPMDIGEGEGLEKDKGF